MAERSSVHQCFNLIDDLYAMIQQARRPLGGQQDAGVINRREMTRVLDKLRDALPDSMRNARDYVDNYAQIIQQTEQDCTAKRVNAEQTAAKLVADAQQQADAILQQAQRQAEETVAAANAQAQSTVDRANSEATATMSAARQEYQRIINDAAMKADQMVEQDDVVRRARATAEEVQADTQREMVQMRQMTFDYLDRVMELIDRQLSDSLTELRMQRTELNNHR